MVWMVRDFAVSSEPIAIGALLNLAADLATYDGISLKPALLIGCHVTKPDDYWPGIIVSLAVLAWVTTM
jgi:hypothetical protein